MAHRQILAHRKNSNYMNEISGVVFIFAMEIQTTRWKKESTEKTSRIYTFNYQPPTTLRRVGKSFSKIQKWQKTHTHKILWFAHKINYLKVQCTAYKSN